MRPLTCFNHPPPCQSRNTGSNELGKLTKRVCEGAMKMPASTRARRHPSSSTTTTISTSKNVQTAMMQQKQRILLYLAALLLLWTVVVSTMMILKMPSDADGCHDNNNNPLGLLRSRFHNSTSFKPLPTRMEVLAAGEYKVNPKPKWAGLELHSHYFHKGKPPTTTIDHRNRISLLTHMDMKRIPKLVEIRKYWKGYISVSILVDRGMNQFTMLFNKTTRLLSDPLLSVHLVRDLHDSPHYPHNFMRNVAMDHALTDYGLILDADFVTCPEMEMKLERWLQQYDLAQSSTDMALIVPAFELYHNEISSRQKSNFTSKAQLQDYFTIPRSESLTKKVSAEHPFAPAAVDFPPSQGSTKYEQWLDSGVPYFVQYEMGYEPYPVIFIPRVPRFWERFRGFGIDKASWMEELAIAGYEFVVLPDVWVTHLNHRTDDSYMIRITRPQNTFEYSRSFQPYLKRTYGRTFYDDETGKNDLQKWEDIHLGSYEDMLKTTYRQLLDVRELLKKEQQKNHL